MVDNFDTLDFEIHAVDAVTDNAGQRIGFTEIKGTKEWDKFDKALVKKKVVTMQAQSCHKNVA